MSRAQVQSDAATTGRINLQRQSESNPTTPTAYSAPAGRGSGYYPGGRGAGWAGHTADRYAPYHAPRGYAHKPSYTPSYTPSYRNRTLVVNSSSSAPAGQQASPATPFTPSSGQWVSKRDRHMQLINTSVYDQKTQQRQLEIEATAQEKQRRRDAKEKARVIKAFQPQAPTPTTYGAPPSAGTAAVRDIQINNLRFRVAADGSKLIRMFGEYTHADFGAPHLICADDSNSDPKATPKQTKVAGVTFHRSKNGNLYRAGLVKKSMRYWNKSQELHKGQVLIDCANNRDNNMKKSSELCPRFTATGTAYSNRHPPGPCATDVNENDHLSISVGRPFVIILTFSHRCLRPWQPLPLHSRSKQDCHLQGVPTTWPLHSR